MTGRPRRFGLYVIPWAGWLGGGLGWFLTHQLGSDLAQADCNAADPLLMLAIGFFGASLSIVGGLLSFRHWRQSSADISGQHVGSRRFLAMVSSMAACIFLLAILFQTISSFIIPQCHQ